MAKGTAPKKVASAKVATTSGKRVVTQEQIRKMQEGRKNALPMSQQTGLIIPGARITKLLKAGKYAKKVSPQCGIWLSAALEQVLVEILDCTIDKCKDSGQKTLKPRHIRAALNGDEELSRLFPNPIIMHGTRSSRPRPPKDDDKPAGRPVKSKAARNAESSTTNKRLDKTQDDEEMRSTAANSEDEANEREDDNEDADEEIENESQLGTEEAEDDDEANEEGSGAEDEDEAEGDEE